jgi:hypothetical protein
MILLPLPPNYWDYRLEQLCLAEESLGLKKVLTVKTVPYFPLFFDNRSYVAFFSTTGTNFRKLLVPCPPV